jgi:hypothetical protein
MKYKTGIILMLIALVLTFGTVIAQEELNITAVNGNEILVVTEGSLENIISDLGVYGFPPPPSPHSIVLTIDPLQLNVNDPQTFATMTVQVLDDQGNPVTQAVFVGFSCTLGILTPSTETDTNGVGEGRIWPGQVTGFSDVTATTSFGGNLISSNVVHVEMVNGVSVDDRVINVPLDYSVESVYPNPFNNQTTIGFRLPKEEIVRITVYDLRGKLVATLTDGYYQAGSYSTTWNPTLHANGVYLIRIEAGEFVKIRNIVFLK